MRNVNNFNFFIHFDLELKEQIMKRQLIVMEYGLQELPSTFYFEQNKYVPEDDDWLDDTVFFFTYSDEHPEKILDWIMEQGYENTCLTSTISRGTIASDYEIFQMEEVYEEVDGELCLENWEWGKHRGCPRLTYWHDGMRIKTFDGGSHVALTLAGPYSVVVQGKGEKNV